MLVCKVYKCNEGKTILFVFILDYSTDGCNCFDPPLDFFVPFGARRGRPAASEERLASLSAISSVLILLTVVDADGCARATPTVAIGQ